MGNLVAEAMLDRVKDQGVTIAIQNGGGVRASIDAGPVTMGEVLTVFLGVVGAGVSEPRTYGVQLKVSY